MWITFGGGPICLAIATKSESVGGGQGLTATPLHKDFPIVGLFEPHRGRGCNRKTGKTAGLSTGETGSRQKAGSTEPGAASGVSGEAIDVRKISLLQIRMLFENLVLAHSGAQPAEHIPYSDAKSPNAGLSPALTGLDCNPACRDRAHFEPLPDQYGTRGWRPWQ